MPGLLDELLMNYGSGILSNPQFMAQVQNAPKMPAGGQQAMRAPQSQPMQGRASATPRAPQGGGGIGNAIGGLLTSMIAPQSAGRNQTIQYLQQQGMDPGTATLVAGDKTLLRQYLGERAFGADPKSALELEKLGLEVDQMRNPTTDDIKEYQFARNQGYQGTLPEFMQEMKKAGASSVTVGGGKYGTIPQGYQLVEGPEGARMEPIPGGPAAAEQEAAAQARQAGMETQADKAETMLDATSSIKQIMEGANTPVTGTNSRPFALHSGTAAGKVRSYVGTLQSGVALQAMMRLKEASAQGATGFGAMNEKELQLLIDDIGALDPDRTEPEIFMKTVDRIEQRYQRVIEDIKRNVSPERIRELGLDALIGGSPTQEGQEQQYLNDQYRGTGRPGEWQDMGDGVKIRRVQ